MENQTSIPNDQQLVDESFSFLEMIPLPYSRQTMIFDNGGHPVDFKFTYANEAFLTFTNRRSEELLHRKVSQVFTEFDPERLKNVIIKCSKALNKGDRVSFDYYIRPWKKWMNMTAVGIDGKQFHFFFKDISNQKLTQKKLKFSEDRFKAIFENSAVGIYRASKNGSLVLANTAALKILGFRSVKDLRKHPKRKQIFQPACSKPELKKKLNDKGELHGLVSQWTGRENPGISIRENSWVIKSDDGQIIFYEGTIEDVTSQLRGEEQISKLNAIFRDLGIDARENMDAIVRKTCEILDGACSLYNRLDESEKSLITWAEHNIPKDFQKKDQASGHICYEATIKSGDKAVAIEDLEHSTYYQTDPNVARYGLRSYLGYPVEIDGKSMGSLCVVDTRKRKFTSTEVHIISTLAKALSLEHRRWKSESELVRSEHRYRSFVNNFPGIAFRSERNFRPFFMHGNVPGITGYSESDFVNGQVSWRNIIHPDDLSGLMKSTSDINEKVGVSHVNEYRIITRDKSLKWVRQYIQSVADDSKRKIFIEGVVFDITEYKEAEIKLRESEEKFRNLIRQSSDGIVVTDIRGNIIEWNKGEESITGIEETTVSGTSLYDVFDQLLVKDQPNKQLLLELNQLLNKKIIAEESGILYDPVEITIKHKNGEIRFLQSVLFPIRTNQGLMFGIISRDISPVKKFEENLKKAKLVAEDASNAKSQFLANMSHEIRTPINAILGFSEILLDRETNDTKLKMLRMIEVSGKSLLEIINDILDLSGIESGKMRLQKLDFNLDELFRESLTIFDLSSKHKNLSLEFINESDLRDQVSGDPYRIKQILMNLISNAIKFTESGSVTVKLREKERSDEEILVSFCVCDTGIGISPAKQENIFEEFRQLDDHLTKRQKGTGLGLTIVKRLVEKMNGRITVESELGKGSRFDVVMPFKISKKKQTPPRITKKDQVQINGLAGLKLLAAEDNELNQHLIRSLAKLRKWQLTIVDTGKKVLEVLENDNFDLILMDVQMPEMNGFEATEAIRKKEKGTKQHIPIIAITAYAMEADRIRCIEAGMDDFISKPFRKDDFFGTIAKVLKTE